MSERDAQFRNLYLDLRIGDQQQYYTDRGTEYRQAHRQAIMLRNAFLVAAALAGVAAQFTAGTSRAACGVGAALLAALAGFVTAFDALIGFPQLQKLYYDAALNLAEARIDWRSESAGSELNEIERVEKILRSENGQWGQLVTKSASKGGDPAAQSGDG